MRKQLVTGVFAAIISAAAFAQTPPPAPATPAIRVGDPGPEGVRIDKDGVFANYFSAKGDGRHPGVMFLGGSEGGLGEGKGGMLKALSDEGYSVLYLCYFGCPNTQPFLKSVPLETFDRGLAFLRSQPDVDPDRIAVVGGSKGGEAALLVGVRDQKLKAVVAGMPSSVAWPSSGASAFTQPSWTSKGEPVPFVPYAMASFGKSGVFGLYNDALPTLAQHQDAVIPVERIAAPIMLVCGESDTLWPSCSMADQVAERLKAKGRPAPVLLRYKDAGHAVFGAPADATPQAMAAAQRMASQTGGTAEGNMAARADGWPKVVAFLRATLKP
jgi:uncharacterized protein